MNNPQILVFDPFSSDHKDNLVSILSEKAQFETVICRNIDELNALPETKWILIFVFMDNKEEPETQNFYDTIFTKFQFVAKIGIIECLVDCQNCNHIKREFCNYITVPFNEDDVLRQLLKFVTTKNEPVVQPGKTQSRYKLLQGKSDSIVEIKNKIRQVAPFYVSVLVSGESGTGKELCARMIHALSPRSEKPFVALNCGAIPRELFENELFGHKKGAYTNANQNETGLVSAANGGTLFLDEVESLTESSQVKLLRFLEEKKYKPLGQTEYVKSDVRVIAAAKKDLFELSQNNQFRLDLFYRLNIVQIYIPPLKDRIEDIPGLALFFINHYSTLHNKAIKGIKDGFLASLLQYDWPGNIRELENMIQEVIVTNKSGWISADDLNLHKFNQKGFLKPVSFKQAKQKAIERFEKKFLHQTLEMFDGNIQKAAQFAQTDRWAFYNLMNKYHIDPNTYRP